MPLKTSRAEEAKTRQCPPVEMVVKRKVVLVQVSSSSLDRGSKLESQLPIALELLYSLPLMQLSLYQTF
ncbi:hypothetical protein TNCV_259611 [Trichonephila clavipes]|uniref:Uncharacterized protein n=1 Tax=Trichonephila clavipes TaxID=2585209 RepID=A0A8X6RW02_TRICX|nr:hypothetical protein TNCV_259611 [Trichonephila clavipes]